MRSVNFLLLSAVQVNCAHSNLFSSKTPHLTHLHVLRVPTTPQVEIYCANKTPQSVKLDKGTRKKGHAPYRSDTEIQCSKSLGYYPYSHLDQIYESTRIYVKQQRKSAHPRNNA